MTILITEQLNYSGILEAVKISRAGYPIRYPHDIFIKKFWLIANNLQDILDNLDKKDYYIGITKIFLSQKGYDNLEKINQQLYLTKIIYIQKQSRKKIYYNRFQKIKQKIIKLQSVIRTLIQRIKYINLLKTYKITKIQSVIRCFYQRTIYNKILNTIKIIQNKFREKKLSKIKLSQTIYKKISANKINTFCHKYLLNKSKKILIVKPSLKIFEAIDNVSQHNNILIEKNIKITQLNDDVVLYKNWMENQINFKIESSNKIYNLESENLKLKKMIEKLQRKTSFIDKIKNIFSKK